MKTETRLTSVKEKKAELLLQDDKVFLSGETDNYEYWIVVSQLKYYTIVFNKLNKSYSCDCPNIRKTECYHIVGVQKFKEQSDAF